MLQRDITQRMKNGKGAQKSLARNTPLDQFLMECRWKNLLSRRAAQCRTGSAFFKFQWQASSALLP